jgi:hypothetical protein
MAVEHKQPLAVVREVYFYGPEPPEGAQFCVICAMRYKAEALDEAREAIEAAQLGKGSDRLDLMYLAPRATLPQPAVALGVCAPLGGILAPQCWSHLQAVKFTALAAGAAGQLPGLVPGRR